LEPVAEDRGVTERAAAFEEATSDINTFWSDAHHCHVVVRLQDRTRHTKEAMEGC
jgi:hypothetical protein